MTNKLIKWGLIALISATPSISFAATQEANCSTAVINGGASIQFYHPGFTGQLPTDGSGYPIRGGEGGDIRVCYYSTNPTLSQTETSGTTYASIYDADTDTSVFTLMRLIQKLITHALLPLLLRQLHHKQFQFFHLLGCLHYCQDYYFTENADLQL